MAEAEREFTVFQMLTEKDEVPPGWTTVRTITLADDKKLVLIQGKVTAAIPA